VAAKVVEPNVKRCRTMQRPSRQPGAVLALLVIAVLVIGIVYASLQPRWSERTIADVEGSTDSTILTVTVNHNDCGNGGPRVRIIRQTDDLVELHAEQDERSDCDDIGLTSVITVDLDAPLGERQLVYDRRGTAASVSSDMSVHGPLVVGAESEVSFDGSLRRSRGGYFWIQELDGTRVALLRSDGNPEIPMSYSIDVASAEMLDDGLSGESSMLVLPPQIEPGPYLLCTANSADDVCIDVDVQTA
jgi:hypothetical protein